jgi:hypothetical protein
VLCDGEKSFELSGIHRHKISFSNYNGKYFAFFYRYSLC